MQRPPRQAAAPARAAYGMPQRIESGRPITAAMCCATGIREGPHDGPGYTSTQPMGSSHQAATPRPHLHSMDLSHETRRANARLAKDHFARQVLKLGVHGQRQPEGLGKEFLCWALQAYYTIFTSHQAICNCTYPEHQRLQAHVSPSGIDIYETWMDTYRLGLKLSPFGHAAQKFSRYRGNINRLHSIK